MFEKNILDFSFKKNGEGNGRSLQTGSNDQLDAGFVEHDHDVRWRWLVGKDTAGFGDVSAAHRSATAELGVIKHEEALAAMAGQVTAHSHLVMAEVEQASIFCN